MATYSRRVAKLLASLMNFGGLIRESEADSGLMTGENVRELDRLDYKYIIGTHGQWAMNL